MWYRLEHGAIQLNSAGTDLPPGTWIAVRESGWYDLAERPPQVQERGQIVGLLEKDDMTPDGQRVTIGWGAGLPCSFSEVRSLSDLLTRTARIMSGFDGLLLYVRESENLDLLAAGAGRRFAYWAEPAEDGRPLINRQELEPPDSDPG